MTSIEPVDPDDPTIDPDTRRRLERVRAHYGGELHTAGHSRHRVRA